MLLHQDISSILLCEAAFQRDRFIAVLKRYGGYGTNEEPLRRIYEVPYRMISGWDCSIIKCHNRDENDYRGDFSVQGIYVEDSMDATDRSYRCTLNFSGVDGCSSVAQ